MESLPVYLFLVTMLVRPQDWVPGLIDLPTADILIPVCLILGFKNLLTDAKRYFLPHYVLLLMYLGIIFVSTLNSAGADAATDETIIFLKRILVFFVIIWLLNTEKALLRANHLFKLMALFLAYQAILQAITGACLGGLTPYPGYEEIRVRWYGDWDGPNVFGLLFVFAIALSVEYVIGQHRLWVRLYHVLLCMAYLTAIYYTNSRGAVVAVICTVLAYFYMWKRNILGIIIGVLCVAALLSFGPSRMGEVHSGESSAHERTWLWEQGLNMLRQNPVLGVGRGQFAKNVDLHLLAHNNYVQNFSELGLTGFFLFICILWFSFKGVYRVGYCSPDKVSELSALGRSLWCALVGFSVSTFFVVMELDLYYWLLGLAVASYLVGRRRWHLEDMVLGWKDAAMVAALMAGIIIVVWFVAVKQFF
jgi:putative inorganic carbon (hco3(-)) transporter